MDILGVDFGCQGVVKHPGTITEELSTAIYGTKKNFIIVWMAFGESRIYFYDENLRIINQLASFYEAKTIYATNQFSTGTRGLDGKILFKGDVILKGIPNRYGSFTIRNDHDSFNFIDQANFYHFLLQKKKLSGEITLIIH